MLLNSKLLKEYSAKQWDESGVDHRTALMIDAILAIWAVPPGHKVQIDREHADTSVTVEIADLIGAGYLSTGQPLYSRPGKYGGHTGTVLSDGRIEVAGQVFESPSRAGILRPQEGHGNGWNFWRLDPNGRRPLKDVRAEYLRVVSPEEAEEDDADSAEVD